MAYDRTVCVDGSYHEPTGILGVAWVTGTDNKPYRIRFAKLGKVPEGLKRNGSELAEIFALGLALRFIDQPELSLLFQSDKDTVVKTVNGGKISKVFEDFYNKLKVTKEHRPNCLVEKVRRTNSVEKLIGIADRFAKVAADPCTTFNFSRKLVFSPDVKVHEVVFPNFEYALNSFDPANPDPKAFATIREVKGSTSWYTYSNSLD
jgi:hypothetical protein